jgi:hypothetical protein
MVLQQLAFQQQQSQAYAVQLASEVVPKGTKRGTEDGGFENLWADMKKRKVEPVYDSGEHSYFYFRHHYRYTLTPSQT